MLLLNLDPNWKFDHHGEVYFPIKAKQFVFSGGEVHIKLEDNYGFNYPQDILITHRVNNSQNLMELILAADAVRRFYPDFKIFANSINVRPPSKMSSIIQTVKSL